MRFAPEHPAGEADDRALQVGHGDVPADRQALDLVELDLRAGRDLLVAVAHAGQDDADRLRAALAHDVDLAGRGVRAQQDARRRRVERVPHVAGRVVRRHVQELEVHLVVFDLRTAVDLEAHVREDLADPPQHLRAGVQPTLGPGGPAASRPAVRPPGPRPELRPRSPPACRGRRPRSAASRRWPSLPAAGRSAASRAPSPRRIVARDPLRPRYRTRTASSACRVRGRRDSQAWALASSDAKARARSLIRPSPKKSAPKRSGRRI